MRNSRLVVTVFQAVDLRDVRMIQRSQKLRFTAETGKTIRIIGEVIGHELQRYIALELGVVSAEDDTHAAFSDLR